MPAWGGGDSIFHRMDALSKFVWLFLVAALAYAVHDLRWQLVLLAVLFLGAFGLARLSPRRLLGASGWFLIIGGCLFFFHNVLHPEGELIYQLGFIRLYSESFARGATFAFRMVIMGLTALLFVDTTSPRALVVGLVHVGVPYRIAWAVFLALRYLPLLQSEIVSIREAQLVRGVRRAGGLAARLEMYSRYTVPLLASAIRKAENTALAMDGRGFGAYPRRVFIDDFAWTGIGVALMAVSFVALLVALAAPYL